MDRAGKRGQWVPINRLGYPTGSVTAWDLHAQLAVVPIPRTCTGHGRAQVARKLKTYTTSAGFFDLAIAAPSMKAALEAWGSNNLFHQGFAKEFDDPETIAAAMGKPGVVLRRAVGSNGKFGEDAELPTDLVSGKLRKTPIRPPANRREPPPQGLDDKAVGRLHWPSRRSRSGAKPIAGAKRKPPRRLASDATGPLRRSRQRWKKLSRNTVRQSNRSTEIAPRSTGERKPRMPAGRRPRSDWTTPCAGHGRRAICGRFI